MPRVARVVLADHPHHITQRGNRREDVFFTDGDRRRYLDLLQEYAQRHGVQILAYCLMTNHVHVVAVPRSEEGLQQVFRPVHMRYAQSINQRYDWSGHLWQGRDFSSVLDEDYMWAAIRYVERNPIRVGMVRKAEKYPWSSAAAHCGLASDPLLTTRPRWVRTLSDVRRWSEWLSEGDEQHELRILRQNTHKQLPCGSASFIRRLERLTRRVLHYRPRGRPPKPTDQPRKGSRPL